MKNINKTVLVISMTFVSSLSFAGFESPFESSVEGLTIPNSHYVGSELVIRGQTPRNNEEFKQLKDLGVKKVLIFKNETKN